MSRVRVKGGRRPPNEAYRGINAICQTDIRKPSLISCGPIRLMDRVVYKREPGGPGCDALNGMTGVVVYIDNTAAPITVQFDEQTYEPVAECRTTFPLQNCRFCRAGNLTVIRQESKEKGERRA